jgi:hypothetical protein
MERPPSEPAYPLPDGVSPRRGSDVPAPQPSPDADSCDWCGSTDLWWRNCKLLCRSCNAIVKGCPDL